MPIRTRMVGHEHILPEAVDINQITDALADLIASKVAKAGGTMIGNLIFDGANLVCLATETIDGRDVSVDGAKLDGIESGATAYTDAKALAAAKAGAGTSIGDLVQLEDVGGVAGLPAVDGSQLTGIAGAGVGGLWGINVETLSTNKTLTPGTDEIYQFLDEGGAHRDITLATAGAASGDRFFIKHNGAYNDNHWLIVKQGAAELDRIYAQGYKEFMFDGTNWLPAETTTGQPGLPYPMNIGIGYRAIAFDRGVAIGYLAKGYTRGISIGYEAEAYVNGLAVGYAAKGYTYGCAVGYGATAYTYGAALGGSCMAHTYGAAVGEEADARSYGVAVGYRAKTGQRKYTIALGHQSQCERTAETAIAIDGAIADDTYWAVQGRWAGETVNDTPKEIFLGRVTNARFYIKPKSGLAFRMIVVAWDRTNQVAMYRVDDGLIKRDAANNTTLVNCTVTTVHEDDAGWNVSVTADDVNEALIITVTGNSTEDTHWAAVMDGAEVRFA